MIAKNKIYDIEHLCFFSITSAYLIFILLNIKKYEGLLIIYHVCFLKACIYVIF